MKINTILLEITDKCNLNCSHCMNRPDCKNIEVDIEKICTLFDKAQRYQTEKIYLSGGEPLLHKSIHRIIELCSSYPKISFVITTNGLLLTSEILRLIEEQGNITLQFSIDGLTKETYEAMRGENTFFYFLKKMKLWDQSTLKNGLARTCITKYNYKEIPDIYRYCISHRLYPSFVFVGMLGNGEENWNNLELNLGQKIWCINVINQLNDQYKLNITPPEAPATCNFTERSGIKSLLIRADGEVSPCQYFYSETLGNAYTQEFTEILNSPWISQYCDIAAERKKKLESSPKCYSCKIKDGCNFGCIGIANDLGDINGYDNLCDLRIMTTICYSNGIITLNKNTGGQNSIQIS